jgi:amidase
VLSDGFVFQLFKYYYQWGETFNNVFGRTLHPYNRLLTPGGSAGGEGALLAMKGSPLGVGTDIGGLVNPFLIQHLKVSDATLNRSVRIPAAFCGLYSFCPSYSRLPYYGLANSLCGQESISSVSGPMSNSLTGIKTLITAIIGSQPWNLDPVVIRKPWGDEEWNLKEHGGIGAQLCFAIMWDNGVIKPHPPYVRAMEMVKLALESSGHKGE